MKRLFFTAVVSLATLAACGGTDNVGACNNWKAKAACGSSSATTLAAINCDLYANTTCDISGYFNCLSTAYVCVNGSYDSSKLGNASSCASQAICK